MLLSPHLSFIQHYAVRSVLYVLRTGAPISEGQSSDSSSTTSSSLIYTTRYRPFIQASCRSDKYHRRRLSKMKRNTRRSSVFLPPPAKVVEQKRVAGSSFDTKFSLPSFTRRVEKLTEDQRAAITKTGFGNLLNIHNQMISKVLLGELMDRWNSENLTFELLHGEVTITPQDVALILGLRVVGKSVNLDGPFSDLEKMYGATPGNRKITISVIEERLESIGGVANEDFVRSFLLYTFGVFLFPNSSGKVDSVYLTLLKDLDKVSEYAWGEAVRQDLFSCIKRRKEESVRWVGGCLLLLQVWSYEHIDIGRPNLLASEQFPRASRWESIRSSYQRQWLSTKINNLEEDQITWELHPTTLESEIDVVKQFIDAETPKEEVPVGQSSDSSSRVIQCEESVTCHPDKKEPVASQYAPNKGLSKNVQSVSESVSDITQCYPQKDLGKNVHFTQEVVSQAESDITQSCSETKETAESPFTQNPDSEEGEDLISEASGASLDIPLEVFESPEISSYNYNDDRLPVLSQRLASLHIQELKELKKENAILKNQVLLIPQLQEEITQLKELKKENAILKDQVLLIPQLQEEITQLKEEIEVLKIHDEYVNSTLVDVNEMLSGYDFYFKNDS